MDNDSNKLKISWYPGHMARAFSKFKEEVKKANLIIEVLDARIPLSSRNKYFKEYSSKKFHIILLNKKDLIPNKVLKKWCSYFEQVESVYVMPTELLSNSSITSLQKLIDKIYSKYIKLKKNVILYPIFKMVVVGIPNVGKSTLINRLCQKNKVKVGKKPGVTLGYQWISLGNNYELLDMPGILEPNLDDPEVSDKLSIIYAITDKVLDYHLIAIKLINLITKFLNDCELNTLHPFLQIANECKWEPTEILQKLAYHYKFFLKSDQLDINRAAHKLVNDFREGKLGKFIFDDIK